MGGEFKSSPEQQAAVDAYDEMVSFNQQVLKEPHAEVYPKFTISQCVEDLMTSAERKDAANITFLERTRS